MRGLVATTIFVTMGLAPPQAGAQLEPVVDTVCTLFACSESCETQLGECQSDLDTCNDELASCNDALQDCQRFPASGQNRTFVAGEDGDPAFGAALSYTDNGDGTITDDNTGLVWEKKIARNNAPNFADPHDADNIYPWRGHCTPFNVNGGTKAECGIDADCTVAGETCNSNTGTAVTTIFEWVAALNAAGFAGHTDWRIPNVRELHSVVHYDRFNPSIDPAFHGVSCGAGCTNPADPACSCTVALEYWSATTWEGNQPFTAWVVSFSGGIVTVDSKTVARLVRAVRGGS